MNTHDSSTSSFGLIKRIYQMPQIGLVESLGQYLIKSSLDGLDEAIFLKPLVIQVV